MLEDASTLLTANIVGVLKRIAVLEAEREHFDQLCTYLVSTLKETQDHVKSLEHRFGQLDEDAAQFLGTLQ